MKPNFEILSHCSLFDGVEEAQLPALLKSLDSRAAPFSKGETILAEGERARHVGVVLSGVVQIVRVDYYGRRSVLNAVESGGIFAEAFVCAGLEFMPVSVVASQKGEALLLDLSFARKGEQEADALQARLLQNLLRDMAQKNLALTQKIRCMSPKTTREKLLEYLLDQAKRHGSATFTIPFDRQALADYLGVERSAMSTELGKLRHEGVLESEGAWFHILTEDNDD